MDHVQIPREEVELLLKWLHEASDVCRDAIPIQYGESWWDDPPTKYYHGACGLAAGTLSNTIFALEQHI